MPLTAQYRAAIAGGALRLRLVATKNLPCAEFPDKGPDGNYSENIILDFDYWAVMPKR